MSIRELDARAAAYFDLQEQIEALQAEADAIKGAIKAAMVEIEQEEITGHGWRATWHNTTTTRIDSKALKAEKPELFAQYSKVTVGTRFTLSPVKA